MTAGTLYTGTIAGIEFKDGEPVSATDAAQAKAASTISAVAAYAKRHGLTFGDDDLLYVGPALPVAAVDARDAGTRLVGTPLRDAAVDPKPSDYLPPTNAGKADPHGPDVVSPEIHGAGLAEVVPGPVDPDPDDQEADETAATVEAADVVLEQPARNGTKAAWLAYAVSQGADEDQIHDLTRDELAEQYGT